MNEELLNNISNSQTNKKPWEPNNKANEFKRRVERLNFNDMYKYFLRHIVAQDDAVYSALLNIYAYLVAMANGLPNSFNFMIAGPSGCGKTEFFRTLEKYMKYKLPGVKVLVKDSTTLTSEGFKGADKDYFIRGINPGDIAIVYLDEFDKLMVPKHTSNGDNVSRDIQSGILQMIEGNKVAMSNAKLNDLDTTKILFIAGGAFEGIHDFQKPVLEVSKSDDVSIGYRKPKLKSRIDITHSDIVAWGGLPELVGRFCNIINFHALTGDVMKRIVTMKVKEFEKLYSYPILVTESFCREILKSADSKFGVRIISSRIWDALKGTIIRASDLNVLSVTLDYNGEKFTYSYLEVEADQTA